MNITNKKWAERIGIRITIARDKIAAKKFRLAKNTEPKTASDRTYEAMSLKELSALICILRAHIVSFEGLSDNSDISKLLQVQAINCIALLETKLAVFCDESTHIDLD